MPESIGSRRRVLKPGIVCDKCNNYFARKVEEPVLNHSSMRNLRAWHQVPNKRGKCPSLVGTIAGTEIAVNVRRDRDGKLQFNTERASDAGRLITELESGLANSLLFKIDMNPPAREMSRFLCKMALEAVAELFSADPQGIEKIVNEPFYDNVRNYARYGTAFTEWPFHQRRIFPTGTLMRHPESDEWVQSGFGCCWFTNKYRETLFAFCFYGVEFVINVGGPSIKGYEGWLSDHCGISPNGRTPRLLFDCRGEWPVKNSPATWLVRWA